MLLIVMFFCGLIVPIDGLNDATLPTAETTGQDVEKPALKSSNPLPKEVIDVPVARADGVNCVHNFDGGSSRIPYGMDQKVYNFMYFTRIFDNSDVKYLSEIITHSCKTANCLDWDYPTDYDAEDEQAVTDDAKPIQISLIISFVLVIVLL